MPVTCVVYYRSSNVTDFMLNQITEFLPKSIVQVLRESESDLQSLHKRIEVFLVPFHKFSQASTDVYVVVTAHQGYIQSSLQLDSRCRAIQETLQKVLGQPTLSVQLQILAMQGSAGMNDGTDDGWFRVDINDALEQAVIDGYMQKPS